MKGKLSKLPRAEQWADRICTQLGQTVESIIEVGRLLMKAKADLAHGEWVRMFDDNLVPFGVRWAQMLMAVAEHKLLANAKRASYLPTSGYTLYLLSQVPEPDLANAFKDGLIKPDMERRDVKALLPHKPLPEAEPFHWLNAVGDLRDVIEKTIAKWPTEARPLAPQALRDLAEILEGECSDASRGLGQDRTGTSDSPDLQDRAAHPA